MSVTAETLKKLALFDTPTICNVIEVFEVRPQNTGYMDARIQAAFPDMGPMVGFAATASFRSDALPGTGDVYGSLADQAELFATLDGPAVVVFQDVDDPSVAATFGEVMCSTYKAFGAAGLITSGSGRDLDQVRDIQFPVFTGSTNCSHGYSHMLHIGVSVRVGGLTLQTGELLHGDLNGVTQIPLDIAAEIADVTPDFIKAEGHVLSYVQSPGEKKPDELRERMALMRGDIGKLRQQCSRAKPG